MDNIDSGMLNFSKIEIIDLGKTIAVQIRAFASNSVNIANLNFLKAKKNSIDKTTKTEPAEENNVCAKLILIIIIYFLVKCNISILPNNKVFMFISTLDPIAFSLGPIHVRYYGLLFSLGFIIGYLMMQYFFRKKQYKTDDLDKLLVYLFIGTVVGARLAHCLIYEPSYYLSHPLDILKIYEGGLASHGGCLGVIVAVVFFLRKAKYKFLELADMICIPTALVCSMIRVGNFFNSEILGSYTNSDYGVVFARLGEIAPRHPAQLYEAFAYFSIFLLIFAIHFLAKKRPSGLIFGLFFTLAFIARIIIEPFKMEQADYETSINVGLLISVPFVIAGICIIVISFYLNKKQQNKVGLKKCH